METKDFTQVFTSNDVSIGYIPGSSKVLFIKTGQGGSIYGYENKYLDLAIKVNEKYDCSVFVSATTIDTKDSYQHDIQIIEKCLCTSEFEISYLGVSKGGLIGLWYGCDEPRIKEIITINAPLMINYHSKTLPGIRKLGSDKLLMVYGSLDPSYKYIPFVDKYANVQVINGADHNLRNSRLDLFDLVTNYFYTK